MQFCEACNGPILEHELPGGKVVTTRPHEILSRGTGGKCIPENQFKLCKSCHTTWHNIGWYSFILDHPHLADKARSILGVGKWWMDPDSEDDEDTTPQVFI